mgnify:CR=1 FL=1
MAVVNKPIKKNNGSKKRKIIWSIAGVFFVLFLGFMIYVFSGLPSLEELENPRPLLASNVFSADGELVGQFFRQNRVEVGIEKLPPHLINALISTEDRGFYSHWGVDLKRFIQAMIKNVFLFRREGASTITQQLAKNLYELKTSNESLFGTVVRKVREWITAIQIEKTYTKQEILELYFNVSWFGHGAYGIEMASKVYFDKDVEQLSVQDCGVIVALLKSAVYYDPFDRYENAIRRRNLVMSNMVDEGFLTEAQYEKLKLKPIELSYKKIEEGITGSLAPHFLEYVRKQMEKIARRHGYDLYEDGLNIYTTLDSRMQKIANNAVQTHLTEFQKQFDQKWDWNRYSAILKEVLDKEIKRHKDYRAAETESEKRAVYQRLINDKSFVDYIKRLEKNIQVGFVSVDVKNGWIKAMVGGNDPNELHGLNRAVQIRRQPGSSFKPFVYATAIDNGLYPAYPILNQPFNYNGWSPRNDDRSTSGFVTLRQGITKSLNLVTARLIIEGHVELWQIGRLAERMGIKSKLDLVPSIALGTSLVSPLEMASAYSTFGNKGIANEPISIVRVEDKNGILVEEFTSMPSEAISEETAYLSTDLMRSVIDEGTGMRVRAGYNFVRPAAGKTGTTQDYADAWFCGFTPQLSAAVWVGFDDQRVSFTGSYGQGARAALPIWALFMKGVYDELKLPLEDFQAPASGDVVPANFCRESIFEYGDPKLYSNQCRGGIYTDLVNVRSLPEMFDPRRDANIKIFDRYLMTDTVSNEAQEIK